MVDGQRTDNGHRTDDGPWLYYKLTNEPKGSGELKTKTSHSDGKMDGWTDGTTRKQYKVCGGINI